MIGGCVLITGVGGFVGRNMAQHALRHHNCVVGIGRRGNLPDLDKRITYRSCDLMDRGAIEHLIADTQPAMVIHLAGSSGVAESWKNPVETIKANVLGTVHLFEAIRQRGKNVRRVLVVSSNHEYGFRQSTDATISEQCASAPESPYGWSKSMQTSAVKLYVDLYKLPIVTARTFNLMGPGLGQGVCSQLINQVVQMERGRVSSVLEVGDITVERDFLDVRDAVNAYWMLLLANAVTPGDIFNVCSGKTTAIADIIEHLRSKTPVSFSTVLQEDLIRSTEARKVCGNPQKLMDTTGWKPVISIQQSLDDTLLEWRERFSS